MEKYYIVDSSILPESFDRVIKARNLLETKKVHNVSEAVRKLVSVAELIISTKI